MIYQRLFSVAPLPIRISYEGTDGDKTKHRPRVNAPFVRSIRDWNIGASKITSSTRSGLEFWRFLTKQHSRSVKLSHHSLLCNSANAANTWSESRTRELYPLISFFPSLGLSALLSSLSSLFFYSFSHDATTNYKIAKFLVIAISYYHRSLFNFRINDSFANSRASQEGI